MSATAAAAAAPPPPPPALPFKQKQADLIWNACPHLCAHVNTKRIPNVPPLLQKVYLWAKGGLVKSDHRDLKKTQSHRCVVGCPPSLHGWASPTVYAAVRATILYAKTYGNGENSRNEHLIKWLEKVNGGTSNLTGPWMDLWNAAKDENFPALHESVFTDGRIGPQNGPWQYPDIPTQFNTNVRPFDLAAALAGNPALPGGIMASTPTVLYDSSAAGATPFIAGQAPGPVAPVPVAPGPVAPGPVAPGPVPPGPMAPTPAAATAASGSGESAGMVAGGPAASGSAGTGDVAPTPGEDPGAPDMFRTHAYFKSIQRPRKNLPSQITFILQADLASKKVLKTLQDAQAEEKQNFYWTRIVVDLREPAIADFFKLYMATPKMHQMFYFNTKTGAHSTDLYLWEWAIVPFLLSCRGVHVEFLTDPEFHDVLQKMEKSLHWETIRSSSLVLGGAYPHHGVEARYTAEDLNTIHQLTAFGVKFWPHPDVDNFTRSKYRFLQAIAPAVHEAGGYVERPFVVRSVEEGLAFLEKNWVIKMDQGDEGGFVYKSNEREVVDKFTSDFTSHGGLKVQETDRRVFFAVKFNRAMIELGEVRVAYCYGVLAQMTHTQPWPLSTELDVTEPLKFTTISAEDCHNQLATLEDIKPFSSLTPPTHANLRHEELWFRREFSLSAPGTIDLLNFTGKVYEALLEIEDSIFSGTRDTPKASSLRLFCRLDIGLVWDEASRKYKYTLNEVQEGMCGLFMLGNDSRSHVPNSFIDGYLRGALD